MLIYSLLCIVSWKYDDVMNSSMTILGNSLELNEIYQFMIQIIHRENSSLNAVGYLIVEVKELESPIIMIK